MESFIDRYFKDIDRNLNDPSSSTRYPKVDRLSDLHDISQDIFDDLSGSTMQESTLGYAEANIVIKNSVGFYLLPHGFRKFLGFEQRNSLGVATNVSGSKTHYSPSGGIQIITASRGFRINPPPQISGNETWVLQYLRAPGLLHFAKTESVTLQTVETGTPGTDAGELRLLPNYYNGMELHIYKAATGAGQIREVESFTVSGTKGIFHLRHEFDPLPTGTVWYEVIPTLPYGYDSIYAMDATLLQLDRREKFEKVRSLIKHRRKKMQAAREYVISNVVDRGPSRIRPLSQEDLMPTGRLG